MERNLGRGEDIDPSVSVQIGGCAERLHHRLLDCFHMECILHDNVTVRQYGIHIPVPFQATGAQIPLIVCTDRAHGLPVCPPGCTRIGLSFAVW